MKQKLQLNGHRAACGVANLSAQKKRVMSFLQTLRPLYFGNLKKPIQLILIFSIIANIMMLSVPLHMMQVYGRVLSSQSLETLLYITLITLVAILVYGACETVRMMLAQRLSTRFLTLTSVPLLSAALRQPDMDGTKQGVVHDLQKAQAYLASKTFTSLFDVPFAPIYLLLLFLLHPLLGIMALVAAALLAVISLLNHTAISETQDEADAQNGHANNFLQFALQRNDEVLAMGLADSIFYRWGRMAVGGTNAADSATCGNAKFYGISRFVRLGFQVLILAVGGWLVINGALHGGMIFAASLIAGKVLQPVEQIIGGWKQTLGAIGALENLWEQLAKVQETKRKISLPDAVGHIVVDRVSYCPDPEQNADHYTLKEVSFSVAPGEAVAILGPSGGGKSTLARIMAGALLPTHGAVKLDGFALDQWDDAQRGAAFGFMPQDVWLFPGTIAENVARMSPNIDERAVIEACRLADVHDLIGRMPDGYNTLVGPGGLMLSGGQRQRIALARAFYGNPKVLLLDEPNAHLDKAGLNALSKAILAAKKRHISVVVISQRQSIIKVADRILILANGAIRSIHVRRPKSAQDPLANMPQPVVVKSRPPAAKTSLAPQNARHQLGTKQPLVPQSERAL